MFYGATDCLDGYLTRYNAHMQDPERPLASLTDAETRLLMDMRSQITEMNILLLEIIFIKNMLEKQKNQKLYYLCRNFWRMITSVIRHRDKAIKLRYALTKIPPKPKELIALKAFYTRTNNRIGFLRNTIIPENMVITPAKEYLEITGEESFIKVIYKFFNNDKRAIYEASKDGKDSMLLDHVLKVVGDAGRLDASRERMEEYVRIDAERSTQAREKERQEKLESDRYDAEASMEEFQRILNKCIRNREDCYEIRFKTDDIIKRISSGKANYYIILCSYRFREKNRFRYANRSNNLVQEFSQAAMYKDEADAQAAADLLQEKYPAKAFDVRQIIYTD